ncbi:MAG TPA: DNA polymerase II large subunit [Candidatus Thermoplasmatota archaeon]|nr:DNA polymerase II large subunit [Candidatus Thermoplasmatota archaeon]
MGARVEDPAEDIAERDEAEVEKDFEVPEVALASASSVAMSAAMRAYFDALKRELDRSYDVARKARARGLDPALEPEIPMAEDLAQRVEELVGPPGVAAQVRELAAAGKNREELSLIVAKDVAASTFAATQNKEKAVDQAVRTGLAILTEGVLVAPLEGVAGVRILRNDDGTDCVAVSYAGPIRAAGGTAQALSLLIADVVRRELGLGRYVPTAQEIERYKEEVAAYKTVMHLQSNPTPQQVELIVKGCPVCIDGEGTEEEEVSGYRNLPRFQTNKIRGGMALVLSDGMILKASKIQKHVKNLRMDGWEFIDSFANKDKGADAQGQMTDAQGRTIIQADWKFVSEITAGRPILAHPSRKGGFRLRYGRARTGGIASTAIHPATMVLCDDFLALGTQMKIERPGKATVVTPCDGIQGPTVVLDNGDLAYVSNTADARRLRARVRRIVDLGDILVPYGEFAENNKPMPQSPYVHEWWALEAAKASERGQPGAPARPASIEEALRLAGELGLPLHPDWLLCWHDVRADDVRKLSAWVEADGRWVSHEDVVTLSLPADPTMKELLVELLALHHQRGDRLLLDPDRTAPALLLGLGLDPVAPMAAAPDTPIPRRRSWDGYLGPNHALALASHLAGVEVRARSPFRVGARMGRPEKAAERKMSPPVHSLFPIGNEGGLQRLVRDAAKAHQKSRDGTERAGFEVEIGMRRCPSCGKRDFTNLCECGGHTQPERGRPEKAWVNLAARIEAAQRRLDLARLPETIKGVVGLVSPTKTPEPLEKGILRAKHEVYTFKDGTIRYDMTDVPLTHFRPREIGTPVERLRELGYTHDVGGEPLSNEEQILELRVQDLIVSRDCGEYLLRAAQFLDELLERFYGLPAFYRAQTPHDLVGHLLAGLAPHTSGAVACRLIGYTSGQAMLAHPFYHAAKRRNCDGDEDCVMLLLDGLLNFSRVYLPEKRGGLMDAPLVLTTRIDPSEIDKEAHNLDVGTRYPAAFYEATMRHADPKEVRKAMDTVESRLGTERQYEGFGYTHETSDLGEGPTVSAYKSLGKMTDKVDAQLSLGAKIRAVDVADVGARVIEYHLLPDLVGNLKAFSRQRVRCTKCNAKFRRIPLKGVCLKCKNNLTMTVYEASVKKYLEVSKRIAERYGVKQYTKQRIDLVEEAMKSLFTNDKVKTTTLADFL